MPSLPKCNSVMTPIGHWPGWGRSPFLSLHQFQQTPTSPPFRKELLTVSPSVAPLRGLPFWVMGFNCREVHWSGVEGGFYFTESCPDFFFIKKRLSEDLPQQFLDRADKAFPVASHPRGSLRDEFPVDAPPTPRLTLDSVHVHVSPELPQL
ncbi:hypothetical protein T12_6800 [Trichinella patagoniensis]|uniref:Uncharacterized protein n=1 Tax=Trichinella patagoniensis TaxID=990121 RepID=A0A0V1A5Y8_9BILA|nr:hypothetical protein T12_6800 [Trichinella patagoniensis]